MADYENSTGASRIALQRLLDDDAFALKVSMKLAARLDKSGGPLSCWPFTGKLMPHGYANIYLCRTDVGNAGASVHRIAFVLANRRLPEGDLVCHHCDLRACGNPAHLFEGTHSDNALDMVAKGRQVIGERLIGEDAAGAVFTNEQALAIVRLSTEGLQRAAIARRLGLPTWHVRNVLHGKAWRRVTSLPRKPSSGPQPPPHARGSDHPRARYSEEQIRKVDALLIEGHSIRAIAAATGVHKSTVRQIEIGAQWSCITGRKAA